MTQTILRYLISIRENGTNTNHLYKEREILHKTFGLVREIFCPSFRLYPEGTNEKLYFATKSRIHPLQEKEFEHIKSAFKKENKIIDIATLENFV